MKRLLLSLLLAAPAVQAQPLEQQMSRCVAITGMLQRLSCYDAAARDAGLSAPPRNGGMAPAPAYVPAPPPAARTASAAPAVQEFGSEKLAHPPERPGQVEQITAAITKFSLNPFGKFTVTLANGQVWRQLDSDDDKVTARKSMTSARVSRGMMGSYLLKFNDSDRVFKVTRAQ